MLFSLHKASLSYESMSQTTTKRCPFNFIQYPALEKGTGGSRVLGQPVLYNETLSQRQENRTILQYY